MFNLDEVYRNTCCMCCGIPQQSQQYFINLENKLVKSTVDHVLLRSLGGPNTNDNLVPMCYECNQTRSNLFAELDEFIDWYWSGEPLPKEKNFSYLKDKPGYSKRRWTFVPGSNVIKKKTIQPVTKIKDKNVKFGHTYPELPSKNNSVPVKILVLNGMKYQEYNHPLFGTSIVKIEE